MSNNSIGSFLAALRRANGMTQKQLAEKLNVSDKAVSRWERDECAPDLSLIPVLAEIYGVTSDEILRGQRANPATEPTPQAEEKSKKRLQYLLSQIKTNYQIRSLVSCLIAAVGLIVAMVLNFAFQRSYAGFLIGCIFFLGAAVCQTIFHIQYKAALENDEFHDSMMEEGNRDALLVSERAYSTIVILFTASIPFIMTGEPYWGLTFRSWLDAMVLFDSIAIMLCLIIRRIINVRKGITQPINWKSPLNKLRFRTFSITVILLVITFLLNGIFGWWLDENPQLYGDSTRYDDWDSFVEYMEQPISPDGEKLTYWQTRHDELGREIQIYLDSENYEHWYYTEDIAEIVADSDGNVLCRYNRYNDNAGYITYSNSDDRLPIYVQTVQQRHASNETFNLIMLGWIPIFLAEAVIVFLRYRKKKSAIT